jgi:O-antigen ligase
MPRRPVLAVAVVFMLACLSDATIRLPLGNMRLEQPALAGLIALTIWHRRALNLPPIRPLLPIIVAGIVYLAALWLSSAFVAPDPPVSLRVAAWSTLSMAGGLAAALLLAGRASQGMAWLTRDTGLMAVVGLLSGIGFALFALGAPWIDGALTALPRVSPLVLEPNLYGSLLAAVTPLALERWRARPSLVGLAIAVVMLLTLGLAVTRGAYIGLVVGLVVYFGLFRFKQHAARLAGVALIVLFAGGAGLFLPKVLLNPHNAGLLTQPPPTGSPLPDPQGELDTLAYRVIRVQIGLAEWQASPWIGLGAYSYGQTHFSQVVGPEVIHVGPVLILHDSGLIGSAGLLVLLGLLGVRLWRTAGDSARGPTAIAFASAVIVLLVAYVVTVALHFAITWLILGGALAATIKWPRADDAVAQPAE